MVEGARAPRPLEVLHDEFALTRAARSTASIYPAFDAAKKAVGLEGVTIHDLRHAAGTLAAWTGATTRELSARLGHASPRAAMRYQHAATTRDKEIAQRLDLLLANTPRRPMARVLPFSRHERAMDSDEE